MTLTHPTVRPLLRARLDDRSTAVVDELVPLEYEREKPLPSGVPTHVRAASSLRRFRNRLVVVQDDVDAFAVRDARGAVRPVLLPLHASGRRAFDDASGNKHDKLDLEACTTLPDGRLVAFGSGSKPGRETLVVWAGAEAPVKVPAEALYAELRDALTSDGARLNVEGAVVRGSSLVIFHRGNDTRRAGASAANAMAVLDVGEFERWLNGESSLPRILEVTPVDLGAIGGVPFGFTDAVALDDGRVVVLSCAEDSESAISDGAVVGCRVGMLDAEGLRMADVCDDRGERTRLKLEGIEIRRGVAGEFDVVADVDRASCPAQLGRLRLRM